MPTLRELLDRLNGLPDAEKDKDAVDAVHANFHAELFQPVYGKGYAFAKAKLETELATERGKVTAAESAKADMQRQLDELKAKNPNLAELQAKYQSDLQAKDEEHQRALQERDARVDTALRKMARAELVRELRALDVDADYAEVLADKEENRARIRPKADDMSVEVLQRGKEIALAHSPEKSGVRLMAEELAQAVPAKFRVSNVDGGAGVTGDDTSAPKSSAAKEAEEVQRRAREGARRFGGGIAEAKRRLQHRSAGKPQNQSQTTS